MAVRTVSSKTKSGGTKVAAKPDAYPLLTAAGERVVVAHLTAEYWPYAQTGGLAEAVSSLARFQAASGLRSLVLVPLYRSVRQAIRELEPVGPEFDVTVGPRTEPARLFKAAEPQAGAEVYFVAHPEYFNRGGLYGEGGADYPDNARRFAFFCQAALAALTRLAPAPLVVHAHDWHAALVPVYLRTTFASEPTYDDVSVVFSVHNAGYQGHFARDIMGEIGAAPELFDLRWLEWYGRLNLLKGGLVFSDAVVTVSPHHAVELRTPDGGFGLHDTFTQLGDRLVGILNGIDYTIWDPARDEALAERFSASDLTGKAACKAALQGQFGLTVDPRVPLFGMATRLVQQKGIDLLLDGQAFQASDAQFVFIGAGEPRYERGLRDIAATMPRRLAVETNFTHRLEHELLAGADMLLMPCLYEPCGLTQMRAQRYGSIPVARRVGGLADTIEDGVTGFLFDEYAAPALADTVVRAVASYRDQRTWRALMKEAMARDFSWERSEAKYLEVYRRVVESRHSPA